MTKNLGVVGVVTLAVVGTAVLALSLAPAVKASGTHNGSPAPTMAQPNVSIEAASTKHVLINTVSDNGSSGGAALNPGFNTIDTTTVVCPATAKNGCTVGIESMIQVNGATGAGNAWAICPAVDGTYMNPPCPFQSNVPFDGSWLVGNGRSSYPVAIGTHTVTMQVYVSASAGLYNWEVDYRTYKP